MCKLHTDEIHSIIIAQPRTVYSKHAFPAMSRCPLLPSMKPKSI